MSTWYDAAQTKIYAIYNINNARSLIPISICIQSLFKLEEEGEKNRYRKKLEFCWLTSVARSPNAEPQKQSHSSNESCSSIISDGFGEDIWLQKEENAEKPEEIGSNSSWYVEADG